MYILAGKQYGYEQGKEYKIGTIHTPPQQYLARECYKTYQQPPEE